MSQVADPTEAEPLDAIPVGPDARHRLAAITAWVVLGLVVGVTGWFLWTQVIDPSGGTLVDRYTNGDAGQTYESVRDQFRATFPTTPLRHEQAGPNGRKVEVVSRPGPGYAFSVTRESQPEGALENFTATLDTAAGALVRSVRGTVVTQEDPVPFYDVAVKHLSFRKGARYYRVLLILATGRLYTIETMMPNSDTEPIAHLAKTFRILGPH